MHIFSGGDSVAKIENIGVIEGINVNDFVGDVYFMNTETEDLLSNGRKLRNGMVVLIESAFERMGISPTMLSVDYDKALRNNRWCAVQDLEVVGGRITFIGEYEDGSKYKRVMPLDMAWYVKIDSIPRPKHFDEVLHLVKSAILDESDEAEEHAVNVTEKIFEIFER